MSRPSTFALVEKMCQPSATLIIDGSYHYVSGWLHFRGAICNYANREILATHDRGGFGSSNRVGKQCSTAQERRVKDRKQSCHDTCDARCGGVKEIRSNGLCPAIEVAREGQGMAVDASMGSSGRQMHGKQASSFSRQTIE